MDRPNNEAAFAAASEAYYAHQDKLGSYLPDGSFDIEYINESFRLGAVLFDALRACFGPPVGSI